MPRHDFICKPCQYVLLDQYRSVQEGASARPPFCVSCGLPMSWIPAARFDLRSDGEGKSGSGFQKFTTYDGRNNPVEIDSLHKLRQVERESEQAARNGEGQQMVFRAFNNDGSNRDKGTLGDAPNQRPSAAAKAKYGLRSGTQRLAGEPEVKFGPGVNESNTSALPLTSGS